MISHVGGYNTLLSGHSKARCSLYNTSMKAYVGGYNTSLSGYSEDRCSLYNTSLYGY